MRNCMSRFILIAGVVAMLVIPVGALRAQNWRLGVMMVPNPGGGIRIVQIINDSPAQRLGLRASDVILTIDGRWFNDPWMARSYVMNPDRTRITLVYERNYRCYRVWANFYPIAGTVTDVGTEEVPRPVQ